MFTSRQRLKKVLVTPEKRKKFENGWNEYCFNFKYCNRWSFLILIAGSFWNGLVWNVSRSCVTVTVVQCHQLPSQASYTNSISNRKQLSLSTPLTLSYQEYQIIVTNRIGKASITASITIRIQLVSNVRLVAPLSVNAVSLVLLHCDMLRHLYNLIWRYIFLLRFWLRQR